ncbi:MAG: hypothetical protein RDV48_06025 [Candidatus Eremiobacteraeota bacterium]|nr:hypothetical protein [Candidatus Eremiobacteraeota bacterium]
MMDNTLASEPAAPYNEGGGTRKEEPRRKGNGCSVRKLTEQGTQAEYNGIRNTGGGMVHNENQ